MNLNRLTWSMGAVLLALIAFPTRASANGTVSGTTLSNRAQVTYNVNGNAQETTTLFIDTTVRAIAGDTISNIDTQGLSIGETKIFTYTFYNTGNRADTFQIEVDSFTLNNGAVGWTFQLWVDNDSTWALADTRTTAATVAAGGSKQCSVAIWAHSTPANSPDQARADFRLKIYQGNVGTADSTGQYTGDNGILYAEGGAGSNEFAGAVLAAARLTLNKIVDSVSMGINPSAPIPGARITYRLTYNNIGTASADSVIIRDTIPANTTFDTASYSMFTLGADATLHTTDTNAGFICQVSTLANPSASFTSGDWTNLTTFAGGTVTHVRWIKNQVAAGDNKFVRFRVFIQ
ncbi:MAG: hypothetical protein AAB229_05355 [Candidatus Hydrogenedentota bacterium]